MEAETGTQSIATAHPGRNGALVSKLSRYSRFFDGLAAPRHERDTWYDEAFPDRFEPRLVFLVHSEERLARVNAALKEWLGANGSTRFQVLVYTFADAAGVLAPYIVNGTFRARRATPCTGTMRRRAWRRSTCPRSASTRWAPSASSSSRRSRPRPRRLPVMHGERDRTRNPEGWTLADLLRWWLDEYSRHLASHGRNESAVRKRLLEAPLAARKLEHVTAAEIEGLLQSKQGGLGPQTINHLRRFLVRAFNKGIKRGKWLGPNPAEAVGPARTWCPCSGSSATATRRSPSAVTRTSRRTSWPPR